MLSSPWVCEATRKYFLAVHSGFPGECPRQWLWGQKMLSSCCGRRLNLDPCFASLLLVTLGGACVKIDAQTVKCPTNPGEGWRCGAESFSKGLVGRLPQETAWRDLVWAFAFRFASDQLVPIHSFVPSLSRYSLGT